MTLHKTYKQPDQSQTIDRRAVGWCGGISYGRRFRAGISVIALLSRPLDFPKGNIEAGENEKQTAIREIWEETSIAGIEFLDGFRMKIEYKYRHGKQLVRKEVVLYLVRARTRKVILSHEHIGFAWRKFDDAMQQLTYLNAKNLLSAAKEHLQQRSLAYR